MNESNGYAVFFFPQALEALGDAIKPYLQDGPAGQHVICNEIDTAGSLLEMTIAGVTSEGKQIMLELMVPGSMVRMVVSSQSDAMFGFGPRLHEVPLPGLPPVGPTAEPAQARPEGLPNSNAAEPSPANTAPIAAAATPPAQEAAKPSP